MGRWARYERQLAPLIAALGPTVKNYEKRLAEAAVVMEAGSLKAAGEEGAGKGGQVDGAGAGGHREADEGAERQAGEGSSKLVRDDAQEQRIELGIPGLQGLRGLGGAGAAQIGAERGQSQESERHNSQDEL